MPDTLRMPSALELARAEENALESRFKALLAEAFTELNDAFDTVGIHAINEHPKRNAEFSIIHLADDHAVGVIRAFNYTAVREQTEKEPKGVLAGFTVILQLHIEGQKDEVLELREESLLETTKEQNAFKSNVKDWLRDRITRWLK